MFGEREREEHSTTSARLQTELASATSEARTYREKFQVSQERLAHYELSTNTPPPAPDFEARLVTQESALKIQQLEEELRKQQAYAQSELQEHQLQMQALQVQLDEAVAMVAERDKLRSDLDRAQEHLLASSQQHDFRGDELERMYTERLLC